MRVYYRLERKCDVFLLDLQKTLQKFGLHEHENYTVELHAEIFNDNDVSVASSQHSSDYEGSFIDDSQANGPYLGFEKMLKSAPPGADGTPAPPGADGTPAPRPLLVATGTLAPPVHFSGYWHIGSTSDHFSDYWHTSSTGAHFKGGC